MKRVLMMCFVLAIAFVIVGCNNESKNNNNEDINDYNCMNSNIEELELTGLEIQNDICLIYFYDDLGNFKIFKGKITSKDPDNNILKAEYNGITYIKTIENGVSKWEKEEKENNK